MLKNLWERVYEHYDVFDLVLSYINVVYNSSEVEIWIEEKLKYTSNKVIYICVHVVSEFWYSKFWF